MMVDQLVALRAMRREHWLAEHSDMKTVLMRASKREQRSERPKELQLE